MSLTFTQGNILGLTPCPVRFPYVLGFLFSFLILPGSAVAGEPVYAPKGTAMTSCTELFISEYVEGSSNNKAIEIYNPTGSDITLTGNYELRFYFNGSTSATTTIALTGVITSNDVFVVCDDSSDPLILAVADQQSTASFFNGDDAIELYNVNTGLAVDVIGQIGFDPGSQWGTGLVSTQDNTIRRMTAIDMGDADGSDVFDPATEWDGFANDDFTDLGTYSSTACPLSTGCSELFISEYVEGSSNNKAIEIYNPTGSSVTLTGNYELRFYFNGGTSATTTIALTGTINSNDVFVVCDDSSDPLILAVADQQSTASFFNGDDAIELYNVNTGLAVDVIGQIGFDPGSEWGAGLTSTQDNTIRRMSSIDAGDPDGSDVFDPAIEWEGFANNDFTGLGSHASICGCAPYTASINGSGAFCVEGNVTFTFETDGGTGPFTVIFEDSNGNQFTRTVNNSGDTFGFAVYDTETYTLVSVTDAAGCQATSLVGSVSVIVSPGDLVASASGTNPSCADNDGTIVLTITGGEGPFTYLWTGTGTGLALTEGDQSGLSQGFYMVTVTDAGTCTDTATAFLILSPDCDCALIVSVDNVTNEDCNGLGSIQFTASNGTAPYTYDLNGVMNTTGLFTDLSAGSYTVLVTDAMDCGSSATATVLYDEDDEDPVFDQNPLPQNMTIACDEMVPSAAVLTATDNCDPDPFVEFFEDITPGNCPQEYTITRTWIASDISENETQHIQVIEVVDDLAPVFNLPLPEDETIACDGMVPLPVQVTAQDNCDPGQVPPVIFINEIHYDNAGTDEGEFIEIAGTAGIDLSNYTLVLYNGNGGVEYDAMTLSGLIDDEGAGFGAVSFAYPSNGIQNGSPDGVALVDMSGTVVQFLSYEGTILATNGPASGMTSTDIGVEEGTGTAIGESLQLTGTGQVATDFTWVGPLAESPGTLNAGQTIEALPGTIIATYMETMMMGDCPGEMIIKRMWTATDACGNADSHMITITLTDGTAPEFVPPLPQNLILTCGNPIPPADDLLAVDNCDDGNSGMAMVWINEIHYDNAGTDVNEFVEVAGIAGTDLSDYSIFLYNGSNGGTYGSMPLSGIIDNESNGFGAVSFSYPVNGLQNGAPDGLALVHGGMVVQFLSYEGSFMAVGGPANGMTSTDIGVEETSSTPIGESLQLTGTGTMYSDFAWNPPAAESPGDINPGQAFNLVQVGLLVEFSETIAPDLNCIYGQTITRTWSVEDGCGNMNTHQQVITIADTDGPVVTCDPITVPLDIDGSVTITEADITWSATDACSPASELTLLPASLTVDCDDIDAGTTFTISVEDECGNIGTCTLDVTVPDLDRCTPEISISDPCICLNNATTLTNGQFGEQIYIKSLTGLVWTITQVTGLYQPGGPNPPAAPTPILAGTTFTEMPVGSGDYFLNGKHIDDIGYTLTVVNQFGVVLEIGNSCAYPNPEILSDLAGTFCLFSDPVDLVGTPGDDNIVSAGFTINGVPATTFDPMMGVGQYVIAYTVDGGEPKAFGPDDPGCEITLKTIVNVLATPTTLSCNNLVQIALDADCVEEITPDMILEGTYGCFDDYIVEMDVTLPLGNGPWIPAIVDGSDVGQTYSVRVTHQVSGNNCWGQITVQDELPPVLECEDLFLSCAIMETNPDYLKNTLGINAAYPNVIENCSPFTLSHTDTWFDLGCNGTINGVQDLSAYILRKWVASDASGNLSTCNQFIYFVRRHVDDVLLPPDFSVSCENPNIDPTVTGMPYLMEFGLQFGLYPNNTYCELQTIYTDQELPVCDGTTKILRTWTIYDWCLPSNPNPPNPNPVYHLQVIEIKDDTPPILLDCPEEVIVSVDPFTCCGTIDLPDVIVTDACSRIASVEASIAAFTSFDYFSQDSFMVFHMTGTAGDFPGNNLWNPDTMAIFGYTPCLPSATHHVYYYVTDDCGNVSECNYELVVKDLSPPVVACDEFTQVSLGISGEAFIDAETFDDGSYDNCGITNFKVRRMSSGGCQSGIFFYDQVKFCCSDVGDTVNVIMRVYDVMDVPPGQVSLSFQELHSNDCMVQVYVEDKIKPVCLPPAHTTVSCENFDPSLWAYGMAEGADNCCMDTVTTITSYAMFDTLCNKGTILRTFRAFDCYNNSSLCTQRIVVNYEQDYYVRFPNDVIVNECNGSGVYGEPTFFGEDCELLGVSYEDEVFTVVPDACYKIERTWDIINWCTYNPNLPLVFVPNPNPNPITNHPSNLPGPVVSPQGTAQPWAPTVVKINSTDPLPTNYSNYWFADANGYRYKQIIKIIDTEDPVFDNCPTDDVEVCDLTENDNLFWNDPAYWDATIGSHDLCEAPSELCITVTDSCGGPEVNVRYILFLDMDGDGVMETEISSTNPPAPNTIPYLGGTAFDNRPVPANQKYRFAIDWTTTGNARTACVRWDWLQQPANLNDNILQGVVPQLPYGVHKIKWIAEDGCGNEAICEYTFEVKDCKKPTVVCLNGLSVNIMPGGMITLWGGDFLQYGEDNCTPANQLVYGVVESDQSTGSFPVDALGNPILNVTFDCNELGTQPVQLWAMDAAGNADFCETYVIVQDNMGNCVANNLSVAGVLATETQEGVQEASVELDASFPAGAPFTAFDLTDNAGQYEFMNSVPVASNMVITPLKDDNPLNGVTTFDLVLISKHILGLEPLNSPYKMIAADANNSHSITTFDIVEFRKLILGIYNELPNNTSWRFVDKSFNFTDNTNPFVDQYPENISIADIQSHQLGEDFVGIKVGDVNNSVIANSLLSSDDRGAGFLLFDVKDRTLAQGEEFEVEFVADQTVLGYQFTLNLDGLEVLEIVPGQGMSAEHFAVFGNPGAPSDAITTSYDGKQSGRFTVRFKSHVSGTLSEQVRISNRITKAEAYTTDAQLLNLALRFNGEQIQGLAFEAYQNIPNPWVNQTQIGFYLPEEGAVQMNVYDESGRLVYQNKADFAAGYNAFTLNRSDVNTTAVLYYELVSDQGTSSHKMIQMR